MRHPREAVLDSSLLLSVTNHGSEQAKQLQTDFVIFDPKEFADKLVGLFKVKLFDPGDKVDEGEKQYFMQGFHQDKAF